MSNIQLIPLSQLVLSPANVRKTDSSREIERLAALLQRLADDKLNAVAAGLTGWKWVGIVPDFSYDDRRK